MVAPMLWVLLLTGYPLFAGLANVLNIFLTIPSTVFSIVFRFLVVLLSIIVIISSLVGIGFNRSILFWSMSFVLWVSYSIRFFSEIWQPYMYADSNLMMFVFVGSTLLPYFAFSSKFMLPANDNIVLNWVFYALLLSGIINLYQALSIDSYALVSQLQGRVSFLNLNPITLSFLGSQLCLLAIYRMYHQFISSKISQFDRRNTLEKLGVLVGITLLVLGGSRGPALALLVSLLALAIFSGGFKALMRFGSVIVGLLILSYFSGIFLADKVGLNSFVRFSTILTGDIADDQSSNLRLVVFENAWAQFISSPLLGKSIVVDSLFGSTYPHNVFLEVLMATGVVGGFSLFCLLTLSIVGCVEVVRVYKGHLWIVLLYFQLIVFNSISGNVWGSSSIWCVMCVLIAIGVLPSSRANDRTIPHIVARKLDVRL